MSDLNDKQARFVDEYLIDLNAKQAAIRAGYSARTAEQQGSRLLSNVKVAAAIRERQANRAERTQVTQDMVLNELAAIGFASLADVTDWGVKEVAIGFDDEGRKLRPEEIGDAALVRYVDAPFVTPINRDQLGAHIKAAVSEVALTKDGFRIKMHDKVGALQLIARHLGMLVDKHEHAGPDGGPIQTMDALAAMPKDRRDALRAAIRTAMEG